MRSKFVSLFAVLFVVAACETTPEETGDAAGAGAAAAPTPGAEITTAAVTPEPTMVEPTPAVAGTDPGGSQDFVVNVGDRVFFDYDKAVINAPAQQTLKRQAEWLKLYPGVTVSLEGHCDERGTREYNLALGERRATAVKDFLVALGIDASRVATISYGKERPAALGHNEAAWAQNRRGVTVVN